MIATSHHCHSHAFLPAIPSPLSPRSANIYGSRCRSDVATSLSMTSTFPTDENASVAKNAIVPEDQSARPIPFAQRRVKVAPTPRAEDLRMQRRGAYLRRVREGRDNRRYESRAEDIMRHDFVERQRTWEAEQARAAAMFDGDEEETFDLENVVTELPTFGQSQMQISSQGSTFPPPEEEVEKFLRDEDQDLEALLEFMPDDSLNEVQDSDGLWSDDVDYDELFSHVLSQQDDMRHAAQEMDVQMDEGEEMDVT